MVLDNVYYVGYQYSDILLIYFNEILCWQPSQKNVTRSLPRSFRTIVILYLIFRGLCKKYLSSVFLCVGVVDSRAQQPGTRHQPPATSHQPLATNHLAAQPPATNIQPPATQPPSHPATQPPGVTLKIFSLRWLKNVASHQPPKDPGGVFRNPAYCNISFWPIHDSNLLCYKKKLLSRVLLGHVFIPPLENGSVAVLLFKCCMIYIPHAIRSGFRRAPL